MQGKIVTQLTHHRLCCKFIRNVADFIFKSQWTNTYPIYVHTLIEHQNGQYRMNLDCGDVISKTNLSSKSYLRFIYQLQHNSNTGWGCTNVWYTLNMFIIRMTYDSKHLIDPVFGIW